MTFAVRALLAFVAAGSVAVGPASAQAPDASGRWDVRLNAPDGPHKATLTLKRESERLTGTIGNEEGEIQVEGNQKGPNVVITYRGGENPILITLTGVQKGDSIAGAATFGDSPGDWTGTRAGGSGSPGGAAAPKAALDISGAWLFDVTSPAGSGTPAITFNQSGETVTGQYAGQLGEAPIQGTLKGAELSFSFDVTVQDTKLHVVYSGTATNDAIKGTVTFGELGEGTFTARRK